jgi:tetratricopeptide (TPR) repeat protein
MEILENDKIENQKEPRLSEEINRLFDSLAKTSGFAIFFVICESEIFQRQLLNQVRKQITQGIHPIQLDTNHNILETLNNNSQQHPPGDIFWITGMEKQLVSTDGNGQAEALDFLENSQDDFVDLNRTLVILLPFHCITILKEGATEFWSWNSGLFNLEVKTLNALPKLVFISDLFFYEFSSDSFEEKEHKLQTYKQELKLLNEKELKMSSIEASNLLGETGVICYELGNYADAEEKFKKQLNILNHTNEDFSILCTSNNLAKVLEKSGKFNDALEMFQDAIQNGKKILRLKPYYRALLICNIGGVYHSLGNYNKALGYCTQSLEIGEKKVGLRSPQLVPILYTIGRIYLSIGESQEALDQFRRILQLIEKSLGLDHPYIAVIMHYIGLVYYSQGNYEEALKYLYRWLEKLERFLGPTHPILALRIYEIGMVHHAQNDLHRALKYYNWALKIREQKMGEDDIYSGKILLDIGKIESKNGNVETANTKFKKVLSIFLEKLPKNHPWNGELNGLLNQKEFEQKLDE